jgi:hypothetical protein
MESLSMHPGIAIRRPDELSRPAISDDRFVSPLLSLADISARLSNTIASVIHIPWKIGVNPWSKLRK